MPPDQDDNALAPSPSPAPEFNLSEAIDAIAEELTEFPDGKHQPAEPPTPPPPAPTPPAPSPSTTPTSAPSPVSGPAPTPRGKSDIALPPKTWTPAAAVGWDKLSESHRAEIHRREEDFFSGIEQYKSNAEHGKTYLGLLQPYGQILTQYKIDPARLLMDLLAAHANLSLSQMPKKLETFLALAKSYQLDLPKLAGLMEPAGAPATPADAPFTDPQVAALHAKVEGVESTLNETRAELSQRKQQELYDQVAVFAKAPGHEHFDKVAGTVAALLRTDSRMTLEQAYETAIWTHPEVRQLLLDKQAADAEAARLAKVEADKEAAKKAAETAGLNVKSRAKPVSATGKATGTVDETLKETMAAIAARGS